MQSDVVKEKSKNTFIEKYGVTNPSQIPRVKEQIKAKRKILLDRPTIQVLKEYCVRFNVKLQKSWVFKNDEFLSYWLANFKERFGEI